MTTNLLKSLNEIDNEIIYKLDGFKCGFYTGFIIGGIFFGIIVWVVV